jgi:hypothetical protein
MLQHSNTYSSPELNNSQINTFPISLFSQHPMLRSMHLALLSAALFFHPSSARTQHTVWEKSTNGHHVIFGMNSRKGHLTVPNFKNFTRAGPAGVCFKLTGAEVKTR